MATGKNDGVYLFAVLCSRVFMFFLVENVLPNGEFA